ncbi:MAG: hypothetical protein AAF682_20740 [Planctomycetota bacterium]
MSHALRSLLALAAVALGVAAFFLWSGGRDADPAAPRRASSAAGTQAPELASPPEVARRAAPSLDDVGPASVPAPDAPDAPDLAEAGPADGTRSLRIRLVDEDGKLISCEETDASVSAIDGSGRERALFYELDEFVLPDAEPGRLWLRAVADGFRPTERAVELRPEELDELGELGELMLDLELPPALVLRVRAVDPNGAPAFESRRTGWVQVNHARVTAVATAEPPRASLLHDYPPGMPYRLAYGARNPFEDETERGVVCVLELDRSPPLSVSLMVQQAVLATQHLPRMADEVVFVVEPGALDALYATVRYRLVDAETRDVLLPSFHMIAVAGSARSSSGDQAAASGGRIEHARVAAGAAQITAKVDGYEELRLQLELAAGEVRDLGDVPLTRSSKIAGVVLGPDGQPTVATLHFRAQSSGPDPLIGDAFFPQLVTKSDSAGRFELDAGRGAYRVWALAEGTRIRSANVVVDTSEGRVDGVLLRCAQPLGAVLIDATGAFEGYTFRVFDAEGFVVESGGCTGPRPLRLALQPGRYSVAVFDEADERLVEQGFELLDRAIEVRL